MKAGSIEIDLTFTHRGANMSLNSVDHRTASRYERQIPVEILFEDGGKLIVMTRDVSASGVFLKVAREHPMKDHLHFLITFPKEITTSCKIMALCDGTIVRREVGNDFEGIAIKIERYEFLGSEP